VRRPVQLAAGSTRQNNALLARFEAAGVDIARLGSRLQEQGIEAFAHAWESLLARIYEKAAAISAR
jgi:transaldolase